MMQCPQCGTSNRLGAIFCRSCGAKLEIDSVTSGTFEQRTGVVPKDKADKKKRVRRIIFHSLRIAFLGLFVFGVYLALQRPDVDKPETTQEQAESFSKGRRRLLEAADQGSTSKVRFSQATVNAYLAKMMADTANEGEAKRKTFELVDSWVLFGDDGLTTWVIDAKLFGRLLRFQYIGTVEAGDDGVVFTPKGFFGGKLGKLPYPTFLMKSMTRRLWNSIMDDPNADNKKLLESISELKFEGDKVTVTVSK